MTKGEFQFFSIKSILLIFQVEFTPKEELSEEKDYFFMLGLGIPGILIFFKKKKWQIIDSGPG